MRLHFYFYFLNHHKKKKKKKVAKVEIEILPCFIGVIAAASSVIMKV